MSALRDVEAESNPLLKVNRKLVFIGEDVYVRLDAVQTILAVLGEAIDGARLLSEAQKQELEEAFASLADVTVRTETLNDAANVRRHSPEAVAANVAQVRRHELGNPSGDHRYYPTDRGWRRRTTNIDGHKVPYGEPVPREERM